MMAFDTITESAVEDIEAAKIRAYEATLADRPGDGWPVLHPVAFHGPLGRLCRVLLPHTEADEAGLLLNALTMFGNANGRGAFTFAGTEQATNLYLVTVGQTAQARKGTATGAVRRAFKAVDPEWLARCVKGGLSSGEGLIAHIADPSGEEDHGIEDKRMLCIESELASVLSRMRGETNSLSAILRQGFDGETLQTLTRPSAARMPLTATDPHVSLIGHIVEDEVRKGLNVTERTNGLANRILWSVVRRSKLCPDPTRPDPGDLAEVVREIRDALDFSRKLGAFEVKRDEAAAALWREVYPILSLSRPGLMGSMTTRAATQVCRLSLIYALADQSREIRPGHLLAALAVVSFGCESVARIFGDDVGDALHDRLLAHLEATSEGMTRTQLTKALSGHSRRSDIGRALDDLAAAGRIRRSMTATAGRPVERWFVCGTGETGERSELSPIAGLVERLSSLSSQDSHVREVRV